LKQHNFTDWIATIPVMLAAWLWMGYSKLPNVLRRWFTLLNIKLGVQPATGNMNALSYDSKKSNKYYWKLVTLWIVFIVIVIYLIIIVWNHTLGGFFGARIPFVVLTHIQPAYDNDGHIALPNYDNWKRYWF
jgi:amino acid permease